MGRYASTSISESRRFFPVRPLAAIEKIASLIHSRSKSDTALNGLESLAVLKFPKNKSIDASRCVDVMGRMSYRALWQTLHDPTRLRILALLEDEELSVAELQEILHLGQSRISTHLAHLRRVGLVNPRREGKRTYYSLIKKLDKETRQILDSALLTLSEVPGAKADVSGLKLVLEKRRKDSRANISTASPGGSARASVPAERGPRSGRCWRAGAARRGGGLGRGGRLAFAIAGAAGGEGDRGG